LGTILGGQIVYAYLHEYPGELQRAVIMNVAIPGIDPWNEVKHNPHIWYFAFHSVSESRSPIKPSRSLTIVCFAFVRK